MIYEFPDPSVSLRQGDIFVWSCISWGRTEEHNRSVGGHEDSFHLQWMACDMVFDAVLDSMKATKMAQRYKLSVKRNGDKTLHFQALYPED